MPRGAAVTAGSRGGGRVSASGFPAEGRAHEARAAREGEPQAGGGRRGRALQEALPPLTEPGAPGGRERAAGAAAKGPLPTCVPGVVPLRRETRPCVQSPILKETPLFPGPLAGTLRVGGAGQTRHMAAHCLTLPPTVPAQFPKIHIPKAGGHADLHSVKATPGEGEAGRRPPSC